MAGETPTDDHTRGLTQRESQVGYWVARGKTNAEIGLILGASPRTIEKHVESLLRKLQVENRTTAALVLATDHPTLDDGWGT